MPKKESFEQGASFGAMFTATLMTIVGLGCWAVMITFPHLPSSVMPCAIIFAAAIACGSAAMAGRIVHKLTE